LPFDLFQSRSRVPGHGRQCDCGNGTRIIAFDVKPGVTPTDYADTSVSVLCQIPELANLCVSAESVHWKIGKGAAHDRRECRGGLKRTSCHLV
jgi:hypothetical protein